MEWLREGSKKQSCLRIQELQGKGPSFKQLRTWSVLMGVMVVTLVERGLHEGTTLSSFHFQPEVKEDDLRH